MVCAFFSKIHLQRKQGDYTYELCISLVNEEQKTFTLYSRYPDLDGSAIFSARRFFTVTNRILYIDTEQESFAIPFAAIDSFSFRRKR